MARSLTFAAVVALALAAGSAVAGDPSVDMKSPDVAVRLAAIESIRTGPVANAEALLVGALADTDWEVIEKAAEAIGQKGADGAAKAVVKIAMEHPARRVRVTAARALARLGTWDTVTDDFGKVRPTELAASLDAMAEVAVTREGEVLVKLVERGLGMKKDPAARAAAARGIGGYPAADRPARLRELSADDDVAVAAAAVDGIRAKRDDACAPVLLEILARPKVGETLARRARAGFVEAVGRKAKGPDAGSVAQAAVNAVKATPTPEAGWQYARLLGEIGELPDEHVERGLLLEGVNAALGNASPKTRAAAAWSLGRIGGDAAADRATEIAKADTDAHVRMTALQSLARLRDAAHDGAFKLFADRLADDPDVIVREEAAVALGRRGVAGAVPTLRKAVERAMDEKSGSEWTVGTSALVSMGKTRAADAVPFLTETSAKAKDWKLRASALVGLGHVQDKAAIPVLIDALGAKEPIYRNVAYEFLRRITTEKFEAKQSDWTAWWKKAGADFAFIDREEEARKAKKYGYSPDMTGVYEGLDVVVLQSEDRIELLLADLKVAHRITRSGQVPDSGLHPFALFFSNCMGKITTKDVEPIAWFVHSGGYLFGSCWALKETVEKVSPGVIRKFPLPGQVLQNPVAEPCRPGSPFVADVFGPLVQPVYILWGSYLIDVLDPERAEVLMDSPSTEEKFGNGNLVAWFSSGHGVVLDSTNHFELQGYGRVDGIEKPEEIMAYALDHLGLTYAELRKVPPAAWKSKNEANKEVKDLACFRFLTNFVRQKRKSQE